MLEITANNTSTENQEPTIVVDAPTPKETLEHPFKEELKKEKKTPKPKKTAKKVTTPKVKAFVMPKFTNKEILITDISFKVENNVRDKSGYGDIKTMAQNVARHGILKNIFVTKDKENEGKYIAYDGHRRLTSADYANTKLGANITKVRAWVTSTTLTEGQRKIFMVLMNKSKNLTFSEYANVIKDLKDLGYTNKQVCEELTISKQLVSQYVKVLSLPQEFITAVETGEMTKAQALRLVRSSALLKAIEGKILDLINAKRLVKHSSDFALKQLEDKLPVSTLLRITKSNDTKESIDLAVNIFLDGLNPKPKPFGNKDGEGDGDPKPKDPKPKKVNYFTTLIHQIDTSELSDKHKDLVSGLILSIQSEESPQDIIETLKTFSLV